MRAIITALLLCMPIFAYSQTQPGKLKIDSNYDKFKNKTSVESEIEIGRTASSPPKIIMQLIYSYPGQGEPKATHVYLGFRKYSSDWEFLENDQRASVVLADGKRTDLGILHSVTSVVRPGGGVDEAFGQVLTKEKFLELASAKTMEFQIGVREYALREQELQQLREFAATLKKPTD